MTRILSYDSDERADSWLNKVLVFSKPLRDEMLQTDPGWRFGLTRKRMDRLRLLSALTAACFIGLVQSQTTLAPAVMNTTVVQNATVVTPTPVIFSSTTPGCFSFNASTCEACAPGSQYDNNTLLCTCCPDPGLCIFPGACLPCKTGFYQPLAGQQQCLACSRGSYTNFTGSPLCHPCPAGSFNNNTAAESCTSCSPGLFASKLGSTSCTPCPQGSFCNSSGCTQCPMCPGGTEALQTSAKDCTPCRPGMHKAPHQTMCQICSSGFYQILWGQESCDLCPESHYCPVSAAHSQNKQWLNWKKCCVQLYSELGNSDSPVGKVNWNALKSHLSHWEDMCFNMAASHIKSKTYLSYKTHMKKSV